MTINYLIRYFELLKTKKLQFSLDLYVVENLDYKTQSSKKNKIIIIIIIHLLFSCNDYYIYFVNAIKKSLFYKHLTFYKYTFVTPKKISLKHIYSIISGTLSSF